MMNRSDLDQSIKIRTRRVASGMVVSEDVELRSADFVKADILSDKDGEVVLYG